jgi:hypothetical protein
VKDAINEAINIGKAANIPVEISHFKVSGPANWGRSRETLPLIEAARKEGYDVTIDQYPYSASSTNLGIRLPDWALAGGQDSLKKELMMLLCINRSLKRCLKCRISISIKIIAMLLLLLIMPIQRSMEKIFLR